ncbi:MAG: TetR/AcrR family transcriptional regulator [Woeseiaceae bacterium]|nr:TetR/AcrR family transcriptional regulator [Woeseiaceae bacterium]
MNLEQNVTARRGRPKSEEKRQQIAEAAAHLFLTEGFERTSMDSIASHAGVSKQTVYSHFANKDELFRSCISGKVAEYDLTVAPSEFHTLESGLRAFSDGYLRLLSDPRVVSMWRLVMAEAIEHPHVTQVFYETGPQQTLDSLTRFLEHHADELDVEDFGKAARTLFGMTADQFQSRIMLGIDSGVPDDVRSAHVDYVTELFLKLFAKPN